MELPNWLVSLGTIVDIISTTVTAAATICLWLVTKSLTAETRRMVDASSQPHIVVTIDSNRWSSRHADLNVDNTGNGTAYDIEVSFDPPLTDFKINSHTTVPVPLQKISVLKPGQGLSSFLSEFEPLMDKTYTVTISWLRKGIKDERQTNIYTLNMGEKEKLSKLGASDPLTQIAEQMKKVQEQWGPIASGARRIKADVFTSGDRRVVQEEIGLPGRERESDN